ASSSSTTKNSSNITSQTITNTPSFLTSPPSTINIFASSSTPSPLSTITQTNTRVNSKLNKNDHEESIRNRIEKWCIQNQYTALKSGDDYTLTVHENADGTFKGKIMCKCHTCIFLPMEKDSSDEGFQISRFYKHLTKTKCTSLKQKEGKENAAKTNKTTTSSTSNINTKSIQSSIQITPTRKPADNTNNTSTKKLKRAGDPVSNDSRPAKLRKY
ncbi:unnamed protein product, partial [Didymodactylos carnosus]